MEVWGSASERKANVTYEKFLIDTMVKYLTLKVVYVTIGFNVLKIKFRRKMWV